MRNTEHGQMSMQRSPWYDREPRRAADDNPVDGDDQRYMLGHILERSTSAPPLQESNLNLWSHSSSNRETGRQLQNDSLFGDETSGHSSVTPLFDNRSRVDERTDSLFSPRFARQQQQEQHQQQQHQQQQPNLERSRTAPYSYSTDTFSELHLASSLSTLPAFTSRGEQQASHDTAAFRRDPRGDLDAFRREAHELERSHSAAPTYSTATPLYYNHHVPPAPSTRRAVLGPPPGMGILDRGSGGGGGGSGSSGYRYDSAIDRSDAMDIRRPASTGVIGHYAKTSSMVLASLGLEEGAVRPTARTLMDLIQEDIPETPLQPDTFDTYMAERIHLDRPRTVSPQRSRESLLYAQREYYGQEDDRLAGLSQGMDRLHVRQPEPYRPSATLHQQPLDDRVRLSTPQYVPVTDSVGRSHNLPGEERLYAHVSTNPSMAQQGHTVVTRQVQPGLAQVTSRQQQQPPIYEQQSLHPRQAQQQQHYEHQHVYYSGPQRVDGMQNVVVPPGHTIYVNAPQNAPPYGYTTVQLHHPHPQHANVVHLPHHAVPGSSHQQEYISVVPIQGGPQGTATYAYWPPELQGGGVAGPQAVTIMQGGTPVKVARIGNPVVDQSPHGGGGGGRGASRVSPEKSSKNRRGGGSSGVRRAANDPKHASHPTTSPLLEEFRASKNRDWTIGDIEGHVVEFCQDQNGSRFIQQRLEMGDLGEKEIVMAEVLPAIRRLRNDVFGNYVVQKLLDFGTSPMKASLRDTLKGEMLQLSLQMYGCRVVQKALESLDEADLPILLLEFQHNVLSCIHDQNGNHVVQKCIEVMSKKAKRALDTGDEGSADIFGRQIDFIIDDVLGNVKSLSCHPYGCRVLQRILEHCVESKKNEALDEISKCHEVLLDDQYGNYVIQHVLQFGRHSDRDSILRIVVANGLLTLSKQKFASNVVEKLLKYGTPQQRREVVREMLKHVDEQSGVEVNAGAGTSVVLLMVRDAYANYVVQTALDVVTEGTEKESLLEELKSHSTELRNYTFAKHIVNKLSS